MAINQTCPYLLRGLYSYDIISAYPKILKSYNYNIEGIDWTNKEERNKAIGIAQINNSNLSKILQMTIDNLIDFYLKENDINENELIIRQKDGFIVTKLLTKNTGSINMDYRGMVDFMIITLDRKKFLYCQDDNIEVKGISRKYQSILKWYQKLENLSFYDKNELFKQLYSLKKSFLENEDKNLFLIPSEDEYIIATKELGDLQISDPSIISIHDIDRLKYYQHYIQPFFKSIFHSCY